jgi:hypothetical protein
MTFTPAAPAAIAGGSSTSAPVSENAISLSQPSLGSR